MKQKEEKVNSNLQICRTPGVYSAISELPDNRYVKMPLLVGAGADFIIV
jgi:hypothetical protein